MSRYLIDKSGEITPAYDERLPEKFGYPMPDFDLPSYAVRNLGAVDVELHGSNAVIRFRWLTVSQAALDACVRLLTGLAIQGVTVHCEADNWGEHRFEKLEGAIAWLQENQSQAFGGASRRTSPHFVVSPQNLKKIADRPLNRLEQTEDHFAFFFKKWRLSQGKFSNDVTEALVRFGDIDRSVIVSERPDSHIVFEHVGARITLYDRSDDAWTFRLSGMPVSNQPDREYGRYVEGLYRECLDRREPKLDHIDALVHDGRGPVRFRYDRLLLPWQVPAGQRILTSLSFQTNPAILADA